MKKLLQYLVLPGEVTDFEAQYLRRMNRVGFVFFALHVPAFMLLAFFNDTGVVMAALLTVGVLVVPAVAYSTFKHPRAASLVYGFTAMLMGGLLVHFGQGPLQIEMHFYFFALIAMLALYGNPLVVLVAALTVALHHLLLWIWLPSSVFNYSAPIWVVAVHAAFVVLESAASCFIARSFFDNVIGLEKIVRSRTLELDGRNRDMRLVLDNVAQGFLTIDREGRMSNEKSAVVERWLGPTEEGQTFADYLAARAPDVAAMFALGWEEVLADVLPLELALAQMPQRLDLDARHYRLGYTPIVELGRLERTLLVISDVTADVERERLEVEQREVVQIFERLAEDKNGFLEFFEEANELVLTIEADACEDSAVLKRVLHTLKGNALVFGIQSIAALCHAMEEHLNEEGARPTVAARAELRQRWERLRGDLSLLLGEKRNRTVEIDDAEYDAILRAVRQGESRNSIAQMITGWRLEPTLRRLNRVAEQAQGIAGRLNKGELKVQIEDHQLRLDPAPWASFWSAFVHVVRNAVNHGLESPDARSSLGKSAAGTLELTTRVEGDEFIVRIADDGRGIDWTAVATHAGAKGLPCDTRAELIEALFEDGVSTASQVSEFSGRGVGMGAVRAACIARGGRVLVASTDGQGTSVEFRFPRAAMAVGARSEALVA